MITRASLRTEVDPGHGGFSTELEIMRAGEEFRMSARIARYLPTPGERGFEPQQWSTVLARDASEVEAFLGRLLEVHKVFTLQALATTQALLHPTFHTFHFEDDAGRKHESDYRIEAGRYPDPRYAELVRDFETFFDKPLLVRSFLESAERRATPPPRPWWRFW